MKDIPLKTFFCNGTQLSNKEFDKMFDEIKKPIQKKQFLFSKAWMSLIAMSTALTPYPSPLTILIFLCRGLHC